MRTCLDRRPARREVWLEAIATLAVVRARPKRILIERGGLRAEVDPADVASLLDELRTPVDDDRASDSAYDVVLDYGDRQERLRYGEEEIPGDIREAFDARLKPGN